MTAVYDRIVEASKRLESVIEKTPLIPAHGFSSADATYIKAENLQKTGSFKLRGAYNRISQLSKEEKSRGVVACSAGNHAQGVAYAAGKEGIASIICMPASTPLSKVERTRKLGAEIVLVPGVYDDAYEKALELRETYGYTLVHPFDDLEVIAGQGTIGLELLQQASDLDVVLVPVGGGGLIAGVAAAIKRLKPTCEVWGVEAEGAPSLKRSMDGGKVVTLSSVSTIADGIAVKRVGDEPFALCQQYVDGVVTVKEGEIAAAILRLLEEHKIIAEGAGAVAIAAAMYDKVDLRGKKAACVLSGGNVDVNVIAQIIAKGLKKAQRVIAVQTILDDKPRQLSSFLGILSETGANVLSVHHDRDNIDTDVGKCVVDVSLETRGPDHAEQICETLRRSGYVIHLHQ
ncbi:MAG: threonine ammonia-lyase [Peptococcaceae bacterium]|jgi:threonine dehydratase|nr:threonine ammonia-lyase [Peptococcaceae bacterium]